MEDNAFPAKVILSSRKPHKCFACLFDIPVGSIYIAYPGVNSGGEFSEMKLCIECSYLLSQKTGKNAHNIRQGEFQDRLLPNCLRKKRTEFRRNPQAAVIAAGLIKDKPSEPPKQCQQIVVKTSEFDRRIFHLPESRYKVEQFKKGGSLTIKAGVNGKSRDVRIVMERSTSGEAFGCKKRQVAVLVA